MRASFLKQLLSRSKRAPKARQPRGSWAHLGMENLEDRTLLSVTTGLGRGILSITADDVVNRVQVTQPTPDQVVVTESDQTVSTFQTDQVRLILFQQGAALSSFDNQTALPAEQLRLWNSPSLSPADLSQTGSLDAVLVDDTLTLAGPSGAGFQITGAWSATDTDLGNGQTQHTFTASGDMVLKTAVGDIPFVSSDQAPLTVVTTGSVAAEFGEVTSASGSSDQILNTTDPANPLHRFQDMFGLQLNPGAVQFSIALGSSLGALGAPLNNALPYLSFTTTNASTAQFGTTTASVGAGDPLTVAFDPEDPSIYAQVNEFTVGGSLKGYIPYTPAVALPHQDIGPVYGHLYAQGSIQPGDVPATLTGAAVFNLDANQDGQLLATLQGNIASQLVTGALALSTFAQAAPADLLVGVNAHMDIGYTDAGFNMSIASDGSAVYTPGHLLTYGTAAGALFAGTPLAFVAPTAAVNVGTDINNNMGKYYVRVRAATATVAGANASRLKVLLTDQGVSVIAHLDPAYGLGSVTIHGGVQSDGEFVLKGHADTTLAGLGITRGVVTLSGQGLGYRGEVSIPAVGPLTLSGSIDNQGQFTLTTTAQLTLAGFSLNVGFTLTNTALAVTAHATGIPLVGTADFSGTINANGFTLTATATNVDLLGFIHFGSIALTLTNTSLTLSAATNLPVVGNVTFTGAIDPSGTFTISATAPSFTLLGFLTFTNATVTLSLPNGTLMVSAGIDLLNIGHATFMGSITAGGHFSFTASASLTVAGFNLGTATLSISDAPAAGIVIGPFTTPPLPLIGPVTIQGSYGAGGQFSFMATLHPTPPIMIGPLPVDTIDFGLTNDSLTLGIGVGYHLGGFLDLTGYGQVTVYAPSAQHDFGDFDLKTSVDVSIVGFTAANGQMELKNTKGQFSFTVDAQINLLIATAQFHGEIDFNKGLVGFAGGADIHVAGFTLSNSNFLITNAQVQFVNGMWSFPHTADGHLIAGNGIHIEVHSHTNLPNILSVNFDGTFAKSGTSYVISVHATANLTIAGFNLASASLVLDNTHLAISVHYVQSGVFTVDFMGTMSSTGAFSLTGSAALGLAGFFSVANATFTLDNTHLVIGAAMDLKLVKVNFSGTFQFNGQFSLTGSTAVGLGGYNAVFGAFTLNNSGASVSAFINVIVASVSFSGSIRTDGTYSLTGSAQANLIGFIGANVGFTLTNSSLSLFGNINVLVGTVYFTGSVFTNGGFSLMGGGHVGFAGFGASASFDLYRLYLGPLHRWISGLGIEADVNVIVATVHFSSSMDSSGAFDMSGQVSTANFAGFIGGNVSFRLRNSGLTVSANVNVFVANLGISGSIQSNGQFRFVVTTGANLAGFGVNAAFTLSNSGVAIHADMNFAVLGVYAHLDGWVFTNGSFGLDFSAGVSIAGFISGQISFHLANNGFSAHVHAGVDASNTIFGIRYGLSITVDCGVAIRTNGTFDLQGNFRATWYAGFSGDIDVGFELSTHELKIHTPWPLPDVDIHW